MKMKKHDLWIVLAAVLCAVALLVGSRFINDTPKNKRMGLPSGVTVEFSDAAPKAGGHAHSWLFASACAEESPAQAASDDAPVSAEADEPLALDEATIQALTDWGLEPAESYLVVWVDDYFQPVPLLQKYAGRLLRIARTETDFNVVEIGRNSFEMHEASCPDQVCVTEGEVTLANRQERILGDYVICMPNAVVLEMQSAQQMLTLLEESLAPAEETGDEGN